MAFKAINENSDIKISDDCIIKGIKNAKWSGRMEIVENEPLVLLDGAHNTDGILMLSKSLKKYFPDKKITMLIGILGDKEYTQMLELIMPMASKAVFTEPNSDRKWNIDSIDKIVKKYNTEIYIEKDISKAYNLAKSITSKTDVVVCAGSLYLIGELYKLSK